MQKKLFNHNFFLSPTSFIITISKPNFKCFNHVFVFASALWWIGRRRNNTIFYEQKWDIWEKVLGRKEEAKRKVVMLGLDAAGKTTILYKFHIGEVLSTVPTIGFNVEKVQYKNVIFTVWDVGGQEKLRPLWRHYFDNTDGLIYVVDSLDRERIGKAKQEFQTIINDPFMLNSVILVFANKQDLRGAMTPMEVCEGLGLFDLKNRKWHIQGTCALKGDGLYEGLDWLASTLKERKAAGYSSIGTSSF
ncbi:ADP-ribosylation factor-like isoform X1 [Glycine soja]|uniref:ADP-ribosylation factor-like isoform X1 n=1 Tax=Glycine soja TaxID=3848 RepID=UPI00103BC9BA|nr:ADP-ribosylation factor-like isoform X1 [Glycine soja]